MVPRSRGVSYGTRCRLVRGGVATAVRVWLAISAAARILAPLRCCVHSVAPARLATTHRSHSRDRCTPMDSRGALAADSQQSPQSGRSPGGVDAASDPLAADPRSAPPPFALP